MGRKIIGTAAPFIESLESRQLLSAATPQVLDAAPVLKPAAVEQPFAHVRKTPTLIKFTAPISAFMGVTIVMTARVRNPDGSPVTGGTVTFLQGNTIFANANVTHRGYATVTFYNAFAGVYDFHCQYDGTRRLLPAVSQTDAITVNAPNFTTTNDGLELATTVNGTGPTAVSGSHCEVEYTEYLSNGAFEQSDVGSTPLPATVDGGGLISGFNEGLKGMQAGMVRIFVIPPDLGYGSTTQNGIPGNSTLVFIVKMLTIT